MIEEYYLKNGEKRFKFVAYLGVDPMTGKQKRTTRRGFKTRKIAQLEESRLKVAVDENGFEQSQKRMKFEEVLALWLPIYEKTVKPSTYRSQLFVMNNHVRPYFGNKYIDKVTPTDCQKYVNKQADKLKNYNNSVNLAYRIFKYAINIGLIKANPLENVIRPKAQKEAAALENYWSKEELVIFLDQLDSSARYSPVVKMFFRLLVFSGMRKSEALALRWSDINFDKGAISITRSLVISEEGYIFQTPKTKASIREISIDQHTIGHLRKYQVKQAEFFMRSGNRSKGSEQLIFIDENNCHLGTDFPNYFLKKIIKEFNLKPITVHGLRHTHCSLLFEAGATVKEAQVRLGHKSIKTTMDIYTHVTEKAKEETADKFAQYVNF